MNDIAHPARPAPAFLQSPSVPSPDAPSGEARRQRGQALAALKAGHSVEAERLLLACLETYPKYAEARHDLVPLLMRQSRFAEALAQTDALIADEPGEARHLFVRASTLSRAGRHEEAIGFFASALVADPLQPRGWLSYGHVLKTVGRLAEAVDAYRHALELAPHLGEAWWSLANLKSVRFSAEDVAAMHRSLGAFGLTDEDHVHIDFALGKAREDEGDFATSFNHYARAATLRRQSQPYAADDLTRHVARCEAVLNRELFAARRGQGCQAPDPIFIVGLPRVGSTLVEQILSSHSRVEPTHELWDLMALARRLTAQASPEGEAAYPACLIDIPPDTLRSLGEDYLQQAAVHRREGRPMFIDKMPNNFAHVGLIQLILPNAKIVDVRRHPMGGGFSVFKQHFAQGQAFSYDLTDIGRYYADYVALMAHFDAQLPGRVHRVVYERLVAEPEAEIRALLDHCGLPFEEACLRFYENGRAVRTPSAEQVRRPIYREATEHWRHFEPWLEPLKLALGPALDAYPDAPAPAKASGSAPRPRPRAKRR